jgi:hypothetical protein
MLDMETRCHRLFSKMAAGGLSESSRSPPDFPDYHLIFQIATSIAGPLRFCTNVDLRFCTNADLRFCTNADLGFCTNADLGFMRIFSSSLGVD